MVHPVLLPSPGLRPWAAMYAPGAGWSSAAAIEAGSTAIYSGSLRVVADGSGSAFAVWTQDDATAAGVYAGRHVAGSGWGAPQLLDTSAYAAGQPEIAATGDGRALAAWMQPDATALLQQVFTSRFEPGSGWAAPQLLMSSADATGYSFPYPRVAVNDAGEGLAVWRELVRASLDFAAWGSRSSAAGVWQTPSRLDGALGLYGPTNGGQDSSLSAALSASGNGMAIWWGGEQVYTSVSHAGGAWGSRRQLSSGARLTYAPAIAMNSAGQGIAAWSEVVSGTVEQAPVAVFPDAADKHNRPSAKGTTPQAAPRSH